MIEQETSTDMQTIRHQRQMIGAIGLTLPFVLLIGVWVFGVPMQSSISAFFYTEMREVFVSASAGVGLFLLTYQGYPRRSGEILTDRLVSGVGGIAVFATAFIPTLCTRGACDDAPTLLDRLLPPALDGVQDAIHLVAAGVFLTAMGVISIRLFTRCSVKSPKLHKQRRNLCYRIFGWTILGMVALLGIVKLGFPQLGQVWDTRWNFTFWVESVALWAFGLSWLLKGRTLAQEMPYFFYAEAD
ncbi:hypothetical protein [Aliiroseovarius sp. 2305UL8-7]|uniref:hypothetical protein n=1 Tax=Aliiroseovarius conchicola TaxID=3121637 RepID=UPI0035272FDE